MLSLYAEIEHAQIPKIPDSPSGDVVVTLRQPEATYVMLGDGLKSGIRANLAAHFALTRLRAKIECATPLVHALGDVISTLEENRRQLSLWSALLVAHFMPSGAATVYAYEMPEPLMLSRRRLHPVPAEHVSLGGALVAKYGFELRENDGLLLFSDGVTQAGVGHGLPWGWGIEGIRREGEFFLATESLRRLPHFLVKRAQELSATDQTDDATVVFILLRRARRVVVLTGPPSDPARDAEVVREFLSSEGCKIVCGGTTAGIVARVLGTEAIVDPKSLHSYCPPRLLLDGVDYATEGAVSLNQLYNLLDAAPRAIEERNVVVQLCEEFVRADHITFLVGKSENPATASQPFFQMRILRRQQIVPLLAEKLRAMGKLVIIEWI
jgi:hypothetical protein